MSVLYRRDQTYVVWDERGLTVRVRNKVRSTRMPELAVTPKLFSRDDIRANLRRFTAHQRAKEANALSGSKRFGSIVYMLLRWDDSKGKSWNEALVSIDLTDPNPKPQLVGAFDGLTLSRKSIDEQLFVQEGKLSVITQGEDTWGLATYNPTDKAFDYMSLGDKLRQFVPLQWPQARFVEDTAYGTTVAGQVNLHDGDRKNLAEGHGPMHLLDDEDPALATLASVDGFALRNLDTGAELPLPKSYGTRRGKIGVLVWSPLTSPTTATLYDPKDWKTVGNWTNGPVSKIQRRPVRTPKG